MSILFLVALAAVPVITTILAIVHPSHDFLWGQRIVRMALGRQDPYRGHRRLDVAGMKEPRVVRATSILTALLGGMIVPGGLAAIVGVIAVVVIASKDFPLHDPEVRTTFLVALSAPSGVIIALRSIRVYRPMLENHEGVSAQMRSLARHSGVHNSLLLLVYAAYGLSARHATDALLWAIYPMVSLVHAGLLVVSARAIDRCNEENERAEEALAAPAGTWASLPEPRTEAVISPAPAAAREHEHAAALRA